MHLIALPLKQRVSWALFLIQSIRATVSHPRVARSSNFGMGLQVARLLIASASHALTPYALARRIFSISDNIRSVDNQWMACCLIWSINIWVSVRSSLWDCVRHTLVIFQIVDNFSTLTNSSFVKPNSTFLSEIRDEALSSPGLQVKKKCKWTSHEHTSNTSLSTSKQIHPFYALEAQWDYLYVDLQGASQAQKVKGTCLQRHRKIVRMCVEGHKRACLRPKRRTWVMIDDRLATTNLDKKIVRVRIELVTIFGHSTQSTRRWKVIYETKFVSDMNIWTRIDFVKEESNCDLRTFLMIYGFKSEILIEDSTRKDSLIRSNHWHDDFCILTTRGSL